MPLPTEAEQEILQIIWEQGNCTVGSVHYELNEVRPRGYTTVLKLMQIMHGKGLLTRFEQERIHFYSAAVSEDETRAARVIDVSDKLFSGSLVALATFALGLAPSTEETRRATALLEKSEG